MAIETPEDWGYFIYVGVISLRVGAAAIQSALVERDHFREPVTLCRVAVSAMAFLHPADSAERIVYRIAGLPAAVRLLPAMLFNGRTDILRETFASTYWNPQSVSEGAELLVGILTAPILVPLAVAWFTLRNGPTIRRRYGKSISGQLAEQFQFYFSSGVLPPWYYIFSLHNEGGSRARSFIQRFETKRALFPPLKPKKGSPLNDKARFASHCAEKRLRCTPTLMYLEGKHPGRPLPERDLFIKPVNGRGGRGAERWDHAGPSLFIRPGTNPLDGHALLSRLVAKSRRRPLIVQPRLLPHDGLCTITTGALPTLRVLTCLNTNGEPEVVAAMLRSSCGTSRTVDNLHAGGIGALIDLETGMLSKSSNLGSDARLGWFSAHPDTGAPIEGRIVPDWEATKAFAVGAHRHFSDRVVVGWDIAILNDGPILIEGNGNPDLDILQRFMRYGFRQHGFADLLSQHLRLRSQPAGEFFAPDGAT